MKQLSDMPACDSPEQLKAGKLRALATASRTRIEPQPDVPTIAESGFNDYDAELSLPETPSG